VNSYKLNCYGAILYLMALIWCDWLVLPWLAQSADKHV